MKKNIEDYLKFYLVLETSLLKQPLKEFISAAVAGGVSAIQLRDKKADAALKYRHGLEILDVIKNKDILFIVNDRLDLALALGADGAHVGLKDMPIEVAKKMMGEKIVGYSCNTLQDCCAASAFADYAGVGPVYFTQTKDDLREVLGCELLERNIDNIKCPTIAIGGINDSNVREVLRVGNLSGVAISSYLCGSENVYDDALKIRKILDERV